MNNLINKLKDEFKDNDLIIKKINSNVTIAFLESLISQDKINEYILKYFINKDISINKLPGANFKIVDNYDKCEYFLYNGYTVIFKDKKIYAIETKADLSRSISESSTELALKGPKNAFVENYQTNIGLIKKKIKSSHLKTKDLNIGRLSNTHTSILYVDNITKDKLINDTLSILKNIDVDLILDSEDLIKYFKNNSIFPNIITTERPDRCADALANGKIVILCDESPNALILPSFLVDFINPFTDRYVSNKNINLTKIIRLFCFIFSALMPAFYIAILNYNEEAIPTKLLLNFAIQRQGVPFPASIECFILLILFEILRESDLRFPNKYGSAAGVIGALILGDCAVKAGLVSPIMIIINAFAYISSLIFPDIEIINALRYYRFFFLICASFLGLYGLILSLLFFTINLCNNQVLGYNYTFPISPLDIPYLKDTFLKFRNKLRSKKLSNNLVKEK